MKKIISILTFTVFLLSSISVFAVESTNGIVIENFLYDSAKYSINISGKINGNMKGIPVTMQIISPENSLLFAEETTSDAEDNTYSFNNVQLPIDMSTGTYTVKISEIYYKTVDQKVMEYYDVNDIAGALANFVGGIPTATTATFAGLFDMKEDEASDTYGEILGMDKTLFTDLSSNITAQSYILDHLKSCTYTVVDGMSSEDLQKVAAKLKDDYLEGIAIGEYQDIKTTADAQNWLNTYYDTYEFGLQDESTLSDETKLDAEYDKKKSNTVFLEKVVASKGLKKMSDIRKSIFDNVLLVTVKDSGTEAERVVKLFNDDFFKINTTNMGTLLPTEQSEIYYAVSPLTFINCEAVGDEIDRLVDAKIESKGNGGNNNNNDSNWGSSGGGGGGGNFAVNLKPPVVDAEIKAFDDLDDVSWAEKEINYLAEKKIINGKAENKFYPKDNITRAEFVKILTLSMGVNVEDMVNDDTSFSDVNEWDWYYPYVVYCKRAGIVTGDDENQFRPNDKITREDIAVIIYRAVFEKNANGSYTPEFNDNNSISTYAYEAVGCLNYNGIVKGNQNNCFEAKNNSTRAEAAVMIYRTFFE